MKNKINILFVIPPYFDLNSINSGRIDSIPVFTIPYGILSIASFLKSNSKNNIKIDLLDLNILAFEKTKEVEKKETSRQIELGLYRHLEEKISKKHYDIVGISALFNNAYPYLGQISKRVKKSNNNSLCIAGGGLASSIPRVVLENFEDIDAVCLAEGEIPFLELVDSDNMLSALHSCSAWITREKLDNNSILKPKFVQDLDTLPILNYELIDIKKYNNRSVDKRFSEDDNKRELSIHTSRGCPYNCIYCSNSSIHGKIVRKMSTSRVMEEVDFMIESHGMNVLLIEDDHFLSDKDRAISILNEISKRKLRIEFPNGLSVKGIDQTLARAMKNAGVSVVNLAVESGSDHVLNKIIKKPHLKKDIQPAVENLRNNDIRVHAFIVVGLPGEQDYHRKETMEMINEVGFDWVYFFLAVPIVGSRLYELCVKNKYISKADFKKHLVTNATICAPGVDPATIGTEIYYMNLRANFISNWNISKGKLDKALPYFESIIKKYPDHAFAYYTLAQICTGLKYNNDIIEKYKKEYRNIISKDSNWRKYAIELKIENRIKQ